MILVEQIVAEFLRIKNIGTDPIQNGPWPTFVGRLPTDPDSVVGVHRESVPTEGREQRFGTVHHEGFQIRTRSIKYPDAQTKILEISGIFDTVRQFVLPVGTKRYRIQGITQFTTPIFIGPDSNNRCNFTLNCMAAIHEL